MSKALKYVISLDVGGTSLKSAILSSEGDIFNNSETLVAINSKGNCEEVISTFTHLLSNQLKAVESNGINVSGIGIGIPGPFDYKNGISLIQGVDKYESIFKINLLEIFRSRLHLPDHFPIFFENDAWSFIRGEAWLGAGKGFNRLIGITLGSGMGSGYLADDNILETGPGIPALAWIGGTKYKSSVLDDRISRRGIIRRYSELLQTEIVGIDVEKIAEIARRGDAIAAEVFRETGEILGEMIIPFVTEFRAECVVIGGKIANAYDLFAAPLENALTQVSIQLKKAQNIDKSALIGAAKFIFKSMNS